jgi:hypothetical protein
MPEQNLFYMLKNANRPRKRVAFAARRKTPTLAEAFAQGEYPVIDSPLS